MARSRSLKPGFFKNETLAELPPLTRILFAGLWCLADREGRIEDRPKRIRAEVLPYDDGSVDEMLNDLHRAGFILRYEAQNQRFIQVLNFARHQNPHVNERPSAIPAPEQHDTSTVQAPEQHSSNRADSLLLTPDSLSPDVPGDARTSEAGKEAPQGFAECWSAYPKRSGGNSRKEAEKAYRARLKAGIAPADLLDGVKRYAAFIRSTGKEGTAYVKQSATFFGTGEHWRESWVPPAGSGTAGTAAGTAPSAGGDSIFRGAI